MAGYRDAFEDLKQDGIAVVALSSDPKDKARETVEEDGLPFPVAWGLQPEHAEQVGAAYDPRRKIIQPAEFLLGPDRKILHTTYSSGPIGRIDPEDARKLIAFLKSQA